VESVENAEPLEGVEGCVVETAATVAPVDMARMASAQTITCLPKQDFIILPFARVRPKHLAGLRLPDFALPGGIADPQRFARL
jgi:hypothetical protein